MRADRAPAADARLPLRELLDALATETAELAQSADALQALFGRLVDPRAAAFKDAVEQAQALDGLVQRLDGLRAFLAGLAAASLDDLRADAAQAAARLRLTTQVRRLGRFGSRSGEAPEGGDCDLF